MRLFSFFGVQRVCDSRSNLPDGVTQLHGGTRIFHSRSPSLRSVSTVSVRRPPHGVAAAESNEAGQSLGMPGALKHDLTQACCEHARRPVGVWPGSVVSRYGFLQYRVIQGLVSHQLLQASVLTLKIFKTFGLIGAHPAVFATPFILRLLRYLYLRETCPIV